MKLPVLISQRPVERLIGETAVRFYPCSLRVMAASANRLSALAKHLSVLMDVAGGSRDQGKVDESYQGEGGEFVHKSITEPINPDLAEIRTRQRAESIQKAIDELMSDKTRAVIGELLIDSLKDHFPRGQQRDPSEAQELIDSMDLSTAVEYLTGLAQANAKVFGDLGNRLVAALKSQAGGVLRAVGPADDAADQPAEKETLGSA